ncbi:MAG: DUF4445 domain-containing protein [Sedimentisphaerales bacterium]|nr:DUF4445 domain-containing protein [Sedimentisphaerales bacterium]
MSQEQIKVTFQPQNREIFVLSGTKITEAAALAGIIIDTPCGGEGTCRKCGVKIISPISEPTVEDKNTFTGDELADNWRLACRNVVFEDTVVEVPRKSVLGSEKIVVDSSVLQNIDPDVYKRPGDNCFGFAVDVGTTTLAGSLVNLKSGDEIGIVGGINPQIGFGEDVISRVKYASTDQNKLRELQSLIAGQINVMIGQVCNQAGVDKKNIYEVTVAGNTAMEHLVSKIDPHELGQLPFEPSWRGGVEFDASELNINVHPEGRVYILPIVGGFIGGDIAAGMLVVDILSQKQPLLLVDVGTNGEIVLVKDNKIMAASTAAGPAFEGAGMSCGSRAVAGAIEEVKFTDDCVYSVLSNTKPRSICGSGLIDAVAEMLNAGIVNSAGRIDLSAKVPPKIAERLITDEKGQPVFVIADEVEITQADIRQIQLAVGAIRAGINIMLKKAGIKAGDLQRVLIAGGFGSFIRRNHAQRIGLLPDDISHEKISFVGNISLAGARLTLLSGQARKTAQELAAQCRHIQLSSDKAFQDEFTSAMIFPG